MKKGKEITKKEIKVEDNFLEEENDKRVIVFVAIAILVIVGTIIGLLVGCEKKEEDPVKPNDNKTNPIKDNGNKRMKMLNQQQRK